MYYDGRREGSESENALAQGLWRTNVMRGFEYGREGVTATGERIAMVDRGGPSQARRGRALGDRTDNASWTRVQRLVAAEVGEGTFRRWLKRLTPIGTEDGVLTLAVPSLVERDRIRTQFCEVVRLAWIRETGAAVTAVDVRFVADDALAEREDAGSDTAAAPASQDQDRSGAAVGGTLNARFTFERFVVSRNNELALAAAQEVARADSPEYGPLYLYGGTGLGKSHLLHAIAMESRRLFPARRVLYMMAENFIYQFVQSLRCQTAGEFKEYLRNVDLLLIDDIHFISTAQKSQDELLHTFDVLSGRNARIVISANGRPDQLTGLGEALQSRLGSGLRAKIRPTDLEFRLKFLRGRAGELDIPIDQAVIEKLADRFDGSVRELEGALRRVVANARLLKRRITTDIVTEMFDDYEMREKTRHGNTEQICKTVAEKYGISVDELISGGRARRFSRPRHIAIYLTKRLTALSQPDIGRAFGGRDHTSVLYAVRRVEDLMNRDPDVTGRDVEQLLRELGG